jgi:hypothetical protein
VAYDSTVTPVGLLLTFAFYVITVLEMGEDDALRRTTPFPFTMMEVGKSGITSFAPFAARCWRGQRPCPCSGRKERDPLVTELYRWYETSPLP